MFHSARITLTAWYLLIIMSVSVIFSFGIYTEANRELMRFERFQQVRIEHERDDIRLPTGPVQLRVFDESMITQARARVILTLLAINLSILGIAGFSGWFLAGRTLKPIQEMVDDQNRFITDASHELRTPLTALKTATEVHLRSRELTMPQIKELLSSNLEEISHLEVLTNDLMQLNIGAGIYGSYSFEEVAVQEILEVSKSRVSSLAKKKSIEIHIAKVNESVQGDKKSLIELFVILLDNAIKYSPRSSKVTISSVKKDKKILISVSDQGIGIDEKDAPFIFERFYRAEKSRSKNISQGFGLGLSIAKKIVEQHRGSIFLGESKKKGATFIVAIPVY